MPFISQLHRLDRQIDIDKEADHPTGSEYNYQLYQSFQRKQKKQALVGKEDEAERRYQKSYYRLKKDKDHIWRPNQNCFQREDAV